MSRGPGNGMLEKLTLRSADGATAECYLHGAHVTSWSPALSGGDEWLWLSERSAFQPGAPIRGGIPVVFPQFATEGPLPRHGFARTAIWELESMEEVASGQVVATLSLTDSPETQAVWPYAFHATVAVRLGGDRLVVTLGVHNTGREDFTFTAALHSYLHVLDVDHVALVGLHGGQYRESTAPLEMKFDPDESIRVEGWLDRLYVDAPKHLTLREG
ncbi:MAG: D-hexose-6-phosphate mutarotase, partial [Gemmatimonadaceae bacterium]|nr:D-hexose-6-phosphate mutarotase [Gemmatimonadaceae bacterium]